MLTEKEILELYPLVFKANHETGKYEAHFTVDPIATITGDSPEEVFDKAIVAIGEYIRSGKDSFEQRLNELNAKLATAQRQLEQAQENYEMLQSERNALQPKDPERSVLATMADDTLILYFRSVVGVIKPERTYIEEKYKVDFDIIGFVKTASGRYTWGFGKGEFQKDKPIITKDIGSSETQ